MRFSLRSVLLTISILALAMAIVFYATEDYRERMAIRAELISLGATFARVSTDRSIGVFFNSPVKTSEFGKFGKMETVEFKGFALDSGSIQKLSTLQDINLLLITHCEIDNDDVLTPLGELTSVRALLIWNTPVTDRSMDAIERLPGLEVVDFWNTDVTQAGIDRLQSARPNVDIRLR